MRRTSTSTFLTALFIGLGSVAGVQAETPRYVARWLPPLETPGGLVFHVVGASINDSGQVIATVRYGDHRNRTRAIRYTEEGEVELLHPPGAESSVAAAINERGQVYGVVRAGGAQQDIFIATPGEGFDFLEQGKGDRIKRDFRIVGMNDNGDVVGHVGGIVTGGPRIPLIYTREEGWRDLSAIDPRIVAVAYFNNRGDIMFSSFVPGGEGPSFLWSDGELFQLPKATFPGGLATGLNDASQVVGNFLNDRRQKQPYLFSPESGVVNVPTRKLGSSHAWGISESGVVAGTFYNRGLIGIFADDTAPRPGSTVSKVRVIAQSSDFRRILPAGVRFVNFYLDDMNERLQFVGTVVGRTRHRGLVVSFPFMASAETGVVNLDDFFDVGSTHRDAYARAIDDLGDILVEVAQGPPNWLILSPVE